MSGVVSSAGERVPGIFGALNVLKAEFLVARRLAFQGQRMHAESPARQHPDDPGLYTDTLDGSLYGEPPALLLLAHRSALDVLDKIAVTANEHFSSGLAPARVEYSRYWRDTRTGQLRPQLGSGGEGLRCLLALAELAGDLSEDGMYPNARLLRNAGTHRLVHATTGEPTGPTQDTFSTVNMPELQTAAIEALQVVPGGIPVLRRPHRQPAQRIRRSRGHLPTAEPAVTEAAGSSPSPLGYSSRGVAVAPGGLSVRHSPVVPEPRDPVDQPFVFEDAQGLPYRLPESARASGGALRSSGAARPA